MIFFWFFSDALYKHCLWCNYWLWLYVSCWTSRTCVMKNERYYYYYIHLNIFIFPWKIYIKVCVRGVSMKNFPVYKLKVWLLMGRQRRVHFFWFISRKVIILYEEKWRITFVQDIYKNVSYVYTSPKKKNRFCALDMAIQ